MLASEHTPTNCIQLPYKSNHQLTTASKQTLQLITTNSPEPHDAVDLRVMHPEDGVKAGSRHNAHRPTHGSMHSVVDGLQVDDAQATAVIWPE